MNRALEDLRSAVGQADYEACSRQAWQVAGDTGLRGGKSLGSDVPHEIGALLFRQLQISDPRRIELLFEVYRDMPCYGLLMYVNGDWPNLGASAKELFWEYAREVLEAERDALAEPLKYSLWCDFFEDSNTVQEAWDNLTRGPTGARRLGRVLRVSGPVPYELKRQLYERLLPEEAWHEDICRSLLCSELDVFGVIDRDDAGRILQRLKLPAGNESLRQLKARLAGGHQPHDDNP